MSTESGYNGWSNYETWCVSLWLSNDEGNYRATLELAEEYQGSEPWRLGQALRDYVDELPEVLAVTEGHASFVVDLLGAALSEVDWDEIARTLIAELSNA